MKPFTSSPRKGRSLSRWLALPLLGALAACSHGGPIHTKPNRPATPTVGNRIPILSNVESAARADTTIADVAVVLPTQTLNPDWAQPGGSASKSYGNLTLADKPHHAWSATIAGTTQRQRLAAAPVVGGGLLYAMDTDGVVHAFDAVKGSHVWQHSFEIMGGEASALFGGGASYDGGKLFVDTGLGDVAALDAKTGKLLWKVHPAGPLRGSPTVAYGMVFVMTQNNEIHALAVEDGKEQWQETASLTATGVFGVAAPAAGQGTVVAGYASGELIAYRYENGRTLWSDALARTSLSTSVGVLTDIDADPIIDRGRIYALGQGGRMAAYELVTGQRIWELNIAGISTPAVAGDWIFTLTDDGKLLCIERNQGKVRWALQLDRFHNMKHKKQPLYWTGPVLAGDKLWLADTAGDLYTVSTMDGVAKKYLSLKQPVSLAPVVAGGILYVLDDSGRITALR
ncbi:MAG TPA: PQQ-binding-like beta-propeller repeat protein [Novosphingobium sp.]|nr:PQQ-binding-like beta-propeller repeat protein [Novosphingobium sp.]